jgi:histidine triad (HIT) family protein
VAAEGCIFCAIVAGDIEAEIVLDGDRTLAFLDHRPLFPGHVLLVPREHHETIEDLPPALLDPFFADGRRLAAAVREAMGSQGTFMAINNVVSQSVPHLHLHVVPRNRKDGLRGFFWPRNPYEGPEHLAETAALIRTALQSH